MEMVEERSNDKVVKVHLEKWVKYLEDNIGSFYNQPKINVELQIIKLKDAIKNLEEREDAAKEV